MLVVCLGVDNKKQKEGRKANRVFINNLVIAMDNWGSDIWATLRGACTSQISTEAEEFGHLSIDSCSLLIEVAPGNTNSMHFCVS